MAIKGTTLMWALALLLGLNVESIASAGSLSPSGGFGIKVVGNKLTDLYGNVLQLQGENVTGLSEREPSMWNGFYNTTVSTWISIKNAWHMNVIRLPVNEYDWRHNTSSAGGRSYQIIVETTVANIIASGMYVIIDLHWAAPNGYTSSACGSAPGCADGQPGYLNTDNSPDFWTSVASTFKNNPAVMFELFNEPFADDPSRWDSTRLGLLLNGGTFIFWDQAHGKGDPVRTSVSFGVAGHQQLVKAIRATGATNVILYSCPGWDSMPSQSLAVKPADPLNQLGATVHYAKGSNADYASILNAGIPIVITEFYTLADRGGYGWAQSNKIGYVMWGANNWSSKSDLSGLITNSPWSYNESNGNRAAAWPPF